MYRIHFEPHGGYFCIQVLSLGFIWQDVKRPNKDSKIEVMKFGDLTSARDEVKNIGLDILYEDRSADKYRRHMQGDNHAVQHT